MKIIVLIFLSITLSVTSQNVGCWKQIDNGSTSVGIKNDGSLWMWGYTYGWCDWNYSLSNYPKQIDNDSDWNYIDSSLWASVYAIKTDATLWSVGHNEFGELGNGTNQSSCTFSQVGIANNWVVVKGGISFAIALKSDGTLWSWGLNDYGQLGNGTYNNNSTPTQIGSDSDWMDIDTGRSHAIALKNDGTIWTWGRNYSGQLGNGTYNNSTTPNLISNTNTFSKISAIENYCHAINTNGSLWAWGNNDNFNFGNGTTNTSAIPIQIGNSYDWKDIKSGIHTSFALKNNNTAWAWGVYSIGALGNGSTEGVEPIPIQIGQEQWKMITCTGDSSLGIKTDGSLWSWGRNDYGQLGLGTTNVGTLYPLPTSVICPTLSTNSSDRISLKIFPNPATTELNVISNVLINQIEIYDITGRLDISLQLNNYNGTFDIRQLKTGIYFIKIKSSKTSQTFTLQKT